MSLDVALPPPDWPQVRGELAAALERFSRLLAAVPDPGAPAVGVWTVAETAVHLSQVFAAALGLATSPDLAGALRVTPSSEGLGTPSGSLFADPESLRGWTRRAVEAEPERDLIRAGELIAARAAPFLVESPEDENSRPWAIDGIRGTPVLFACHLLSEILVHGDDIARAGGLDWPVPPRAAAMVVRSFMFDVVCQAVTAEPGRPFFRIDLHLVGQDRFHLVKDPSGMRIEPPSGREVDVHLRAHPAGLLAMIWRRRSALSLVARGHLQAWGRRPWKIRDFQALTPDV